jgi:hypothetical protein
MSAPETALATTREAGLTPLGIERALKLVQEAKELPELRDIRNQAQALTTLARSQAASREVQNGAAEVKLRAERKMGEILAAQAETGARATPKSTLRRGSAAPSAHDEPTGEAAPAPPRPPTLAEMGIDRMLAQRVQRVAKVPEEKLETFIRTQKEHPAGEITTAGLLKVAASKNPHAASRVNDGDPEKNDRFTEEALVKELHKRFRFTVDAAGHPEAPAEKIIGRCYTLQDDGLEQDYTGELPFTNCPWDFIPRWAQLIWEWTSTGRVKRWVLLIPGNRFEQPWAQEWVEPYRPDRCGAGVRVENLRGRRKYGMPGDPGGHDSNQPNMPSAVVIFEGPFRRSPDFPPLVDCNCLHEHTEGLPCTWDGCECKAGKGPCPHNVNDPAMCPQCERGEPKAIGYRPARGVKRPAKGLPDSFLKAAKTRAGELGWSQFLDEVAKLSSLSGQLGKTKGQPCVTVRCDAWPEKPKGWRCTKTWRFPLNAAGLLPRAELQQLQQHARAHVAEQRDPDSAGRKKAPKKTKAAKRRGKR